ncbi:MAG: MBL fold metallo-hydrolase [Christensenella sp.]|uniref:MBL fold metallo-hydrolase n=1 Tax=Christensenella sp. TaxID=1935934 RepID=UPI002B21CD5D|nr:MBL fold metallo-hydrolase [Christensenella sp.]MEA5003963.1 MBL fold metallo-hydrolase [Christensenella sp.]
MLIEAVITGRESGLFENCYIVRADGADEAVVIDPGEGAQEIIRQLDKLGLGVSHILLTHGHADHIAATDELRDKYGAKVAIHEKDADMLGIPSRNLSAFLGRECKLAPADILLPDGDTIDAAGLSFRVLHTPGHTRGGVCYLVDDVIFSGDTLFAGSIGRTDFPGSDWNEMAQSLALLKGMERDYAVYPGHGEATTLEREKHSNPFMQG